MLKTEVSQPEVYPSKPFYDVFIRGYVSSRQIKQTELETTTRVFILY